MIRPIVLFALILSGCPNSDPDNPPGGGAGGSGPGETPAVTIFEAISDGNDGLACELAQNPENLNLKNESGRTAIEFAYDQERAKVVDCLAKNGANIDGLDFGGEEPIIYALNKGRQSRIKIFLQNIAKRSNAIIEGMPPLFWAFKEDNKGLFGKLLAFGTPPNQRYGDKDNTILMALVENYANESAAPILSNLLNSEGLNINAINKDGNTAYHLASKAKNFSLMQQLKDKGADENIRNAYGQTASDLRGKTFAEMDLDDSSSLSREAKKILNDPYLYKKDCTKFMLSLESEMCPSAYFDGCDQKAKKFFKQSMKNFHSDNCRNSNLTIQCPEKYKLAKACYEKLK